MTSVHWLWPVGARKLHVFLNRAGSCLCGVYHVADVEPAPRWVTGKCAACSRAVRKLVPENDGKAA